jgi:NADPH-dependent curcumin reductase
LAAPENRAWRVARLPAPGEAVHAGLFELRREPVPEPGDGECLVRTLCLAPGPAQRAYLTRGTRSGSSDPLRPGNVMRGRGVGQVVRSRHPGLREGDFVVASLGWQDYSIQRERGADFIFSTRRLEPPPRPLSLALGVLGQAGVTAYFGMREAGELREGDAVLVSAAAGGIGSVAGQVARLGGAATVVGLAGTPEKCRWLTTELGFNAAINYRDADFEAQLAAAFPRGIDLFFDNVGGRILDAGLGQLARGARVVICGFISTDYAATPQPGPAAYKNLLYQRATMRGYVWFDYWERYAEAEAQLTRWLDAGQLRNCEDVTEGLERMPDCLAGLFSGANRGISICRVAPDPC